VGFEITCDLARLVVVVGTIDEYGAVRLMKRRLG
jgi:hypothetical protein